MKQLSPEPAAGNLRVFVACLLSFAILITPLAAIAAPRSVRSLSPASSETAKSNPAKSTAEELFVNPPTAVPLPAPLPAAPVVGSVTSSLTASLLAVNGGVDADSDGKADPGDTIAYTLTLTNSSGAGATGLAIANPLDSHTALVSLNSTPVAFDQSVSLNEDATLVITLSGQDPDGTVTPNFTFKKSDGTAFPLNPTTIATAHGTIGNFGSVSCDANGVCSQQVTYTPAANYNGPDSFSFKANDSTANSNENGVVSITVNAVNDAPTFTVPGNPGAVNEDAGGTTVSSFITGVRPAQSGNATEDSQNVSFVITNVTHSALFTAGGQPTLTVSNSGNQPFPLTANLIYTPAPNANGTSVVTYHLHDNGGTANTGVDNSADQTFTITVNAVNDAPVAQPKAFTVQANMKIVGLTGLLTGVTDPDATNGSNDPLSFDAQAGYTAPVATVTSLTLNTCTNGTISGASIASGTFDFDPPPGLGGGSTCVLNYQVTDTKNPAPGVVSATQTITITAQGPVIWFVDPNRANNGNGTLSNASDAAGQPGPFKTLSSANAKLATLATNQKVFIYTGTTASGVGEVLDLAANSDWLVGQGTVAASFDSFFGLTAGNAPPAGTVARPALNSNPATAFAARPTVSGTVTMRNSTQVTGVKILTTGSNKGLTSAGFTSGTSLIKDVSVTSATGNGVDLSGTQTITYETSDGTNSPNVLVSVGGIALTVSGTVTIGANGFTFKSISANGGTNGIVLNNTGGTAGLTVTGTGTTAGSGGTIQNCTQKGADFRTATNISLSNMNFTGNGTVNLSAATTCGDALNGTNGPTTCNSNISLLSVTTATLNNVSATGSKQIGIDVKGGSNLSLTNMTVTGNGNEVGEDGVQITDLTGTLTISGGTFKDNASNQFEVQNGVAGPLTVNAGSSATFSNTAFPTGVTTPANTTSNSGLFLATHNSAVMNPTITNCIVDRIYAQGIRLDMAGASSMTANIGPASGAGNANNITNSNQAISVTGSNTGGLTYNIRNNIVSVDPAVNAGGATNQIGVNRSTASGTWTGLIETNFVGNATVNSGCQIAGCDGIDITNNSAGTHKLTIKGNNIKHTEGSGIVIISGGAPDSSTVSWTVQNNTIGNPDQNAGAANPAIIIQSGTSIGTDSTNTCAEISGNTITGTWSLGTGHLSSIRVRSLTTGGSFSLKGFNPATEYPDDPTGVVGSTTGPAGAASLGNVADYIRQQNPGVSNASPGQNAASANKLAASPNFSGSVSCPLLLAEGGVMAALNSPSLISSVFFSATEIAPAASSAASPITLANAISTSLSQPQLDTLVEAAILRWTATGLGAEQIASLREIKFEVTDLTNAYLAESSGNRILVDRSAEGKGWFLDSTPQDDSEFANAVAATRRYTDPQSAPAGHIDLLTAIEHEMGHKLGLGDSYLERDRNDLMYGYLTVGERRLPEKGQAAQPTAGGTATSHYLALEPSRIAIAFGEVLAGAVGAGTEVFDKAEALVDAEVSVGGASAASNKVAPQINQPVLNVARANSGMSGLRAGAGGYKAVSGKAAATGLSAVTTSAPPTPVGSFPINGTGAGQGFTLPDGKTITITFKATLNAPPNFASYSATQKVSAQATLTGSFVGNPLLSDDPSVVGATDPTSTNVDLYDSTTTVVSSANPANTSQSVTFTATIGTSGTPNGSATNRTGTVVFKDSFNAGPVTTLVCSGGNQNVSSNQATCITSSLATGSHAITADYSGDGNFDPSTAALSAAAGQNGTPQIIAKSGTNATLTSSLNPSTVTQTVTFTATITTATSVPNPTGSVIFKDGVNPITCTGGTQTLNGSGVATCQISSLSSGNHPITADYGGDTNFNANNGIVLTGGSPAGNQTVNKATPTVTLVSSTNPSFVSQNVTFTATVTAPVGITATPSGTLTFRDGGAAMTCTGGNQTLSGGVATCQKNNLTAGSHTITVDYPATDPNFNAVSGTAMTANAGQNGNPQVVNQSNTTMTVTSSPVSPILVSQSVTFTVKIVSSNGSVTAAPTGTVRFFDGASGVNQIGSDVTLTPGAGGACPVGTSCADSAAISTLTAGSHTITVDYLGDSNYTANSTNIVLVVNKSDTTTTLTANPPGNQPTSGANVDFTAQVGTTPPNVTFTNTGTVQFKDGANPITCTGAGQTGTSAGEPLNGSGQAVCSTSALSNGAHPAINAVYSGDATFKTSSNSIPYQVGPACGAAPVVTKTADTNDGVCDSDCSLREAIQTACDGGTINFDTAGTFATPQTITISSVLSITKNVTITGPGSANLSINGAGATQIFNIGSGKTVNISGMALNNGKVTGANGGAGAAGLPANGGGVSNAGTLTLTNVIVNNGQAIGGVGGAGVGVAGGNGGQALGGNIYNDLGGSLTLNNSTVSNGKAIGGAGGSSNTTNGNGGGAFGGGIYSRGTLNISNSTVGDGNAATGAAAGAGSGATGTPGDGLGGGIYNDAFSNATVFNITSSTISGNSASANGGGIANVGTGAFGPMSITNSTISGNSANNDGGGIYNDAGTATSTLTSATVTDNHADSDSSLVGSGGGIRVVNGPVVLKDTIVAANYQASLQVESATVTGGPVSAGQNQVETLTVVVTSPPITTIGTATLKVTINGTTLGDKTISLGTPVPDTAATIAVKISDLLNADGTVHGPFTATASGADVILTANSPLADDPSLNLAIVGCGTSPCTGLNSAPFSANTLQGIAPAGANQVETLSVLSSISGCPGASGTINLKVIATGMAGSGTSYPITVNQNDSAATVANTIRTFLTTGGGAPDVSPGYFSIGGSNTDVVFTKNAQEANDPAMDVAVLNGTCTVVTASANTTAGVAPPGIKQVETLTVTGAITSTGAGDATVRVTINGADIVPDFTVPLANDDTAALVAGKIRDAIDVPPINTSYVVSVGTGVNDGDVILTRVTEAADDTSLKVSIRSCSCTGLTGLPNKDSVDTVHGAAPTRQVETMTVLNGPISGCPGGGTTGDVTVLVIATGMPSTGIPFTVPVNKLDTADTAAGKVRDFINDTLNGGVAADVRGYFDVTASGANVIFTRKIEANNDPDMAMSVTNGTCSGINSLSADTTPGVATVTGQAQVETATVSITSPPISTNGTGIVRVTINNVTLADKTISLVKDETAAQVATDIKNLLNADGTIHGPFTADVGTGADTNKVILTRNSPAANDGSLNIEIVGCGPSCPGLNSTPNSVNTTTGFAPGGKVKVTITANPSYFGASLPVPGTKDILVSVAAGDTASGVAAKVANALNGDSDVSGVFLATSANETVRLTRKIVALNDTSLTISIDNAPGFNTGITLSTPQPSDNTRVGGGSVIHDDISGAIDSGSTYNLVGVDTGMTGMSNAPGDHNQIGTGGSAIDPKLNALDNLNGGPTKTHSLKDDSTAIDKGNNFGPLPADQRGLQRTVDQLPDATYPNVGDGTDIGAYEKQTPPGQPTIALIPSSPTTTRDTTPDFSIGNVTIGATVQLLRAAGPGGTPTAVVASTTAGATTVTLTDNTLTADGTYTYAAKQIANGEPSLASATLDVTVDTRPTVTALLSADDTGASSSDKITKNTTPRFTGTADPSTSLQLFASLNGGPYVQVGTGTSGVGGAWTIMSSALVDGPYTITAKEVIGGFTGNASTPLAGVVIDTAIATPGAPALISGDDSGAADNITNKNTPTFTGTRAEASSVQLFVNGSLAGSASLGTGTYNIGPIAALSDGTYLITVVLTDVAGNVSAPGSLSLTIDTQIAVPSTPDLITTDDSGTFNNDNYTNKNKPTFSGTAESGSTVKVFADNVEVGSGTATGGSWNIVACVQPACTALADGTYQITATATDTAGNTSLASSGLSVTIDTVVPLKPTAKPDLIAADDTGKLPDDNITKTTKPTFIGANTVEASSIVDLFADNGLGGPPAAVGTGSADGSGAWSILACTLPGCNPFADGTYLFTVKATDLAGNQSVASDTLQVVIDTVPPPVPSTPVLNPADDTGISPSDKITKVNTPNFTGEAEADSTVQLFAGATPVGSGLANGAPGSPGNKAWTIISGLLPDNSYSMTAQATDVAGNTSGPSGAFGPLLIDTVKPTVAMSSAAGNPTATTPIPVSVTFSEPVFGFTLGGIVPGPPAPPPPAATAGNFAGSGANYTFDLTPGHAGGVFADIPAGGATDTAGNGNTAAVQFNRTFDPSALNATITAISPNPRNTAVASIQIVFNKPVTGFDLGDLTLKRNNGANLLTGAQTLNSADNATWTLGNLAGLTTAEGTYDLKLTAAASNIKDSANTDLTSDATASWVMDTTAPTVTVEQVGPDPVTGPTGTTTINFTATFSESVTGLTPSGVTLFGTANPTIVNVTGSGAVYNLAVQGMNQTGTVRASVKLNAAADSAGNGNAASTSVDNTVQFNADNFSTLEVNSTADPGDGVCDPIGTGDGCTLREAINAANADAGAETITFAPALTSGGAATITLLTVLPDITTDMTIQGPGSGSAANLLTVQRSNAAGRFRIFNTNSAAVTISRLIISNGFTADGANNVGGTGVAGVAGGGILNAGTLTLTNVTVSSNQTGAGGNGMFGGPGGAGGGISNTGTLTVTGSTINANQTGHGGDGNAPPPPNGAGGAGGGIFNTGTLRISISTISGNQTGAGGSNGSSGNGGGVYTDVGTVTVSGSTVTLNSAGGTGNGGGIYINGGTVTLRNTIVGGGNTAAGGIDINGTVQSDGFNLIQSLTDATINANPGAGPNITGADPLLNALADNGGPTKTHSLQCTSPVIDKGTATLTTLAGAIDNVQTSINVTSAALIPAGVGFVIVIDTEQMVVTSKVGNTLTVTRGANSTTAAAHANAVGVSPSSSTDQRSGSRPFDLADSVYGNASGGDGSDIGAYEVQSGGGCLPEAIPPSPQPSTTEDTAVVVNLRGEYGQNTNLIFTVTAPGHGSLGPISSPNCAFNLKMVCTATVTYTPAADFNGLDTFRFKAVTSPGGLESDEADVNITLTEVNDPPLANGDALTDVAEDSSVRTIPFADLLANDSPGPANESGQTITIISVGSAVGGAVSIQGSNVLFTPAPNFNGAASFKYTIRDNGTTNGAPDAKDSVVQATVVFNVTPTPDTPSVTNATTNEDTQTTSGLVITRNAGDGAEVTNFKITGITNGTLFQSNGSTPINNGDFITVTQGNLGLKFTPNANLFSPTTAFSFQAQASLDNTDAGLGGGLATATITVNAIADTPSVTNATTSVNTQTTSGLVITRNAADSTEVTNFKITNIQNGTLFKNNGSTQINNNDFITAAEGNAGLKFTPATNLLSPGTTFSFDLQASTSNADAGLGGSVVTATITVTCGGSLVVNSNDSGAGSLRAIILTACPGTTITFDMTPGHVTSPINLASGLVIDKSLTIQGPGANLLTMGGNSAFRLMSVNAAGVNLTINGLAFTGGGTQVNAIGAVMEFLNAGTLTLTNDDFFANAGSPGTAVVYASLSTGLTVNGSTFRGNPAPVLVKSDRTPLTVVNSTFSGNTGTAIYNAAVGSTVTNTTIADNNTGIQSDSAFCSGCAASITVTNTLLSSNGNINLRKTGTATITSGGRNLIDDATAAAFTAADPTNIIVAAGGALIGPLANNGGPTQTRALLAGSPALDAGDNAAVVNPPFSGAAPFNDQRGPGFLRIRDAADVNTTQTVDIGAYEADPSIEDISNKSTSENSPVSFTFNVGDAATAFDSITTNSSNTTLLPNANIQITGSGSSRTMTLTPAASQSGSSTITVTVTKTLGGAPRSMTDTFVLAVNDGGTLQFSSGAYSVVENAGPGAVTITRTGGTAGMATVQVATSNGTAVAGTDYTAVSQTVTFNDGETSKVVTVPIIDNLNNQASRTINLTLSNVGGSGQLGAPTTTVLTIMDNDPVGGYIRFSSSTYTVGEGGGSATITVERLGTLTQPVTVDYATSDDSNPPSQVPCAPTPGNTTATSRCDFNTAIGRISFAAGDGASKTFTVLINQDTYQEGPENLPLTLSNLTGGAAFASPSTATLNITDDDLVAPTGNTIDDPASFVRQHYRDFLNREADAAGLAFWTNQLTSCGADAQCIEVKRVNVSAAFFLSIEFQVTGGTAYLTNRAAYGGLPSYVRFETDAQALGKNYVFGAPGAEAILEANKVAYFNEYVTRAEFKNTYDGETDQSYVNTLISNTGVAFTQLERDALINGLANQTETRATVLRKIAEKPSFRQAETNSMFVLMEYFGYLHRNPDTAGFNFWLNKLNQFNGNFIQADMVKAFINSSEYRQRFGP